VAEALPTLGRAAGQTGAVHDGPARERFQIAGHLVHGDVIASQHHFPFGDHWQAKAAHRQRWRD
jgi:hypothetical protein